MSLFELGAADVDGGNFAGEIVLKSTNASYTRNAALQISNGDIAAHAVLNMASTGAQTKDQHLGFGVNAERVTIAGLKSGEALGTRALVFSGSVGVNSNNPDYTKAGDGQDRTLVIDTAKDTEYHFRGVIGKNLNVEKSGEGTQILSGASTAFNGDLIATEGKLTLQGAAVGMLNGGGALELRGGTLDVDSRLSLSAANGKSATVQGGESFMTVDADSNSVAMQGARLENTLVHLSDAVNLQLSDVVFCADSQLTGGVASIVNATNVTLVADAGVNAELTPVPQVFALAPEPTPTAGILTLTNLSQLTLDGTGITIDLSSFSPEALLAYDTIAITLGENASFASDADVRVSYAGSNANAAFLGSDYSAVYFNMKDIGMAPEPATATLSLLALAALAARRRRH